MAFTPPASAGGIANVVEDTSPSAGGDFDMNGFDLLFTGGTGVNQIIIPDNVEDALSFKDDGGGATLLKLKTANGFEQVEALAAFKASDAFTVVGATTLATSLTGVLRADSGVVSTDSDVTDLVSAASKTLAGKVELATTAEIETGTDTGRAMPVDQFVASDRNIRFINLRVVAAATDCATGTTIEGDFTAPFSGTIIQSDTDKDYFCAYNDTAGTTGTMVVDIHLNGTTIMTTNKLDIETGEKTTADATTQPDVTTTAITAGDIITVDIDTVHTTPAKGLTVRIPVRLT